MNAAGGYEEKLLACEGCDKNCIPPPSPDEGDDRENQPDASAIVDSIEAIAAWERAGFATDWSCYSFADMMLYREWREAEDFIHRQQQARIQAMIAGFSGKSDA